MRRLLAPRISWRAVYVDGRVLNEGPGAYAEIDRTRLRSFELLDRGRVVLSFRPDARGPVVYRKRHSLEMGPSGRKDVDVYLVGCADGPVCALWPDGNVQCLVNGWDETDSWLSKPILREDEIPNAAQD